MVIANILFEPKGVKGIIRVFRMYVRFPGLFALNGAG